jgi:hypothetical protein
MRTTLPSCIQTVSSYALESSLVHEVSRLPPGHSLNRSARASEFRSEPLGRTHRVRAAETDHVAAPPSQRPRVGGPTTSSSSGRRRARRLPRLPRSPGGRPQPRGRRGRSTALSQPCRCLRPLYLGRRRSPWPVSLICMRKYHMRKDSPENDAGSEVELG